VTSEDQPTVANGFTTPETSRDSSSAEASEPVAPPVASSVLAEQFEARTAGALREPAEPADTIGVAIVSWNVCQLLARCLESLGAGSRAAEGTDSAALRIVVVDNASADGTASMVRERFPDVVLIANRTNRGFTAANNQAFRALGLSLSERAAGCASSARRPARGVAAEAPLTVVILNPDTETSAGDLRRLDRSLLSHPRAGAAGPLQLDPGGAPHPSRRRFPRLVDGIFESGPLAWSVPHNLFSNRLHMRDLPEMQGGAVDWLSGAAIAFRAEALEAVGGFDEGYFMYSEELDLCMRLRRAGWASVYVPEARVLHREGSSSSQVPLSRQRQFMASRARFFRIHHGLPAAAAVRLGLAAQFALVLAAEAGKWLVGHRRELRAARVRGYASVLVDLLTGRRPPPPSLDRGAAGRAAEDA